MDFSPRQFEGVDAVTTRGGVEAGTVGGLHFEDEESTILYRKGTGSRLE